MVVYLTVCLWSDLWSIARLDYRQTWDKDFREYLKKLDESKPVVLCGDLNVAHKEIGKGITNYGDDGDDDDDDSGDDDGDSDGDMMVILMMIWW